MNVPATNDIDALLIGALYGELTPADEARLSAHLESHPTDRSALDGLRSTRNAVRESRFLTFQLDPPQAISALLLQEAARRAPKVVPIRSDKDAEAGWFMRFVRSFAAHPAMAAAAMLVMVVGVGGLLYMKNGSNQFAESTSDDRGPAMEAMASGSGSAAMTPPTIADQLAKNDKAEIDGKATTESFHVDLVDGYKNGAPGAGSAAVANGSGAQFRDRGETKGIVVHTQDPMVKDLPDQNRQEEKQQLATSPKKTSVSKTKSDPRANEDSVAELAKVSKVEGKKESTFATGPTTTTGSVGGNTNAVSGAGTSVATNSPPPPDQTKKPAEAPKQQDVSLLAWAKDTHAAATKAVKAKNCAEAARLASMIGTRVPEYYNSNIVNDRDLKACQAYIANEREKDAEQSNKARAQKRIDANEPSPSSK